MSHLGGYSVRMMTVWHHIWEIKNERVIASFGEARLMKRADGRLELRGGTADDQTAAKEWISLFMHEAVLRLGAQS